MRLVVFYIISIFSLQQIHAQKRIEKQLDATDISTVVISGNTMFKINLNAKPADKVNLRLTVEGENNEQIVLKTYKNQDTLFVGSAYQPIFNVPDDKLSAHKKISIELDMVVPEHLNINIKSDIASVQIQGIYNTIFSELVNGNFKALNFSSDLLVNTIHGNMHIETNNAELNLHTKNGTIDHDELDSGKQQISLNSINGNIRVIKTQ